MARTTLPFRPFLPIILTLVYISGTTASSAPAATTFIKEKCSQTTYPSLCIQSLSTYGSTIQTSPRQLAQTALSVCLQKAQSTKEYVTKLTKFKGLKSIEYAAIKDCLELMSDKVDSLSQSISELKNMGNASGEDFIWHMSNVQTWVSAALTDDDTCLDGFSSKAMSGRIKTSMVARITDCEQVTSNALALVNQYAGTY